MLASPAIARMPSTERTQRSSSTEAIARSGEGKMPIAQEITARIRISHKVTGWLLIEKRTIFGPVIPDMGAYPRSQRIIRIIIIVINIIYCVSTSFGVIG